MGRTWLAILENYQQEDGSVRVPEALVSLWAANRSSGGGNHEGHSTQMKTILKSYLFWTYPRGSFHYDVMVTLILIFIFGSPFVINYRERPQQAPGGGTGCARREDRVNAFVYEISAGQLPASSAGTTEKEADPERSCWRGSRRSRDRWRWTATPRNGMPAAG